MMTVGCEACELEEAGEVIVSDGAGPVPLLGPT